MHGYFEVIHVSMPLGNFNSDLFSAAVLVSMVSHVRDHHLQQGY